MPKLKTHKGTSKVCNVRPGGTIAIGKPGSRHNTGKKNAASNRKSRSGSLLSQGDYNRIKGILGK
ncbi:MAG: 50S ribosomal protein L35 [Bacilli bacterium]|nr:50S ribosomal protein L35 [Bacilli bacterium]